MPKAIYAEMVRENKKEPKNLAFTTNAFFTYTIGDETEKWLLDAGEPDGELLDTIGKMSCYMLDESQGTRIREVSFAPEKLGSWKNLIRLVRKTGEEKKIPEKMAALLDKEGEDKWLEAYDKWWVLEEAGKIPMAEFSEAFKDYVMTGIDRGLVNNLRTGVSVAVRRAVAEGPQDSTTTYNIDSALARIQGYTDGYLNLIVYYNDGIAAWYEELAGEEEQGITDNLLMGYRYRIRARMMRGMGEKAFDMSQDPHYASYLELFDLFVPQQVVWKSLFAGRPVEAAQNLDSFAQNGQDYFDFFQEAAVYLRRGEISEEDYSAFVQTLKYPTGIQLSQLTAKQFSQNLRLGDVVVAADGYYFGYLFDQERFFKAHPKPKLTILRKVGSIDASKIVFTMEAKEWGTLYGSYPKEGAWSEDDAGDAS